jgi:hypothetical protein
LSIKNATRKAKSEQRTCACCSVNFDPSICSQCQVAGCAANKKGEKCRLSSSQRAGQKLSEFQLRERVAELEKMYAELLTESQRLARVNLEYEANWPKGLPRLDRPQQTPIPLDAAGVDPNAQRGKISMLQGARQ